MLGRVNVSEMEHGVRDAAVLHAASGGQNTTVTLTPLSPHSVCVCVCVCVCLTILLLTSSWMALTSSSAVGGSGLVSLVVWRGGIFEKEREKVRGREREREEKIASVQM